MDDSVEVFWDHDSPTPTAWRRFQGPCKSDEDTHCSPKLHRTKRNAPSTSHRHIDDGYGFEQSRKEVDQIINAFRRTSRESELSQNDLERRLIIPEIPEEDESDDDKIIHPMPFKTSDQPNTSLDVIFNMSGNGEEMPATTLPVSVQLAKGGVSPGGDSFGEDDDIFNNDILMSQVENAALTASQAAAQPVVAEKRSAYKRPAAHKTSTPTSSRAKVRSTRQTISVQTSSSTAKGFLDFFMDDKKPTKPSPTKGKVKEVANKTTINNYNYKFSKNGAYVATKQGSTSTAKHMLPQLQKAISEPMKVFNTHSSKSKAQKISSSAVDTTIPIEVLEDIIMEDSWVDTEDEMETAKPKKPTTANLVKDSLTHTHAKSNLCTDNNLLPARTSKFSNSTAMQPRANNVQNSISSNTKCGNPNIKKHDMKASNRYKFQKTTSSVSTVPPRSSSANATSASIKKVQEVKNMARQNISSDGFSSDDEDMLLEAVALTESQEKSHLAAVKPTTTNSKPQTNGPSPSKCSASEIERKKQLALERRMQRMNPHR